jgi:hypothetical protein
MFLPALVVSRRPPTPRVAATCCATLLVAGAAAAALIGGVGGNWTLVIAQGAAWSIAWATRLGERGARDRGPLGSPLAGAVLNALLVLALGAGLERYGLRALLAWQLALGAAAAVWLLRAGVGAVAVRVPLGSRPRISPASVLHQPRGSSAWARITPARSRPP